MDISDFLGNPCHYQTFDRLTRFHVDLGINEQFNHLSWKHVYVSQATSCMDTNANESEQI